MKRHLLRHGCLVLSLLFSVLIFAGPALAGTSIIVTTTSDVTAIDSLCSLREAVIAANTDSPIGDCPAGNGADTILFSLILSKPAVFILDQTGADENSAQTGDLDIAGIVTISSATPATGGVDSIVIDGNGTDRVFEILSAANVSIQGVTIRNGDPGATADGGGILVDLTARLMLTDSQIISNSALNGGGVQVLGRLTMNSSTVAGNHGGGIDNNGGLVTLSNVEVHHNNGGYGIRNQNQAALTFSEGLVSSNQGGGIYNAASSATLNNLTIVENSSGGGIYNVGATLTHMALSQSLVMSNTATSGGGIFNEGVGAKIDIATTQIRGNQATTSGGGLFNNGLMTLNSSTIDHNQARAGGGIHHFGGNLSLTNNTISQNSASDNGGGLYDGGSAVLKNSTFSQNSANGDGGNIFNDEAQLSIGNTIVAAAQAGGNCFNSNGFFTSLGHNLESTNSCGFNTTGDLINSEPKLGVLQDNGGNIPTQALLSGSPAIDAGDPAQCPKTDQRGATRPQGSGCDIGAYEVGELPIPTPTKTATATRRATSTPTTGPATATNTATSTPTSGVETATVTNTPVATETPSATETASATATSVATKPATPPTPVATNTPEETPSLYEVEIEVEPFSPNSSETISITVSGVSANNCTPHYQSHQVENNLILIESAPSSSPVCVVSELPWGYTIAVGPLAAGNYTVTHTLKQTETSIQITITEYVAGSPVFPPEDHQPHDVVAGEPFSDEITATSDLITTYSLVQAPAGMTIDPVSGRVDWIPDANMEGDVVVIVRASNALGSDEYRFHIMVHSTLASRRNFLPLVIR